MINTELSHAELVNELRRVYTEKGWCQFNWETWTLTALRCKAAEVNDKLRGPCPTCYIGHRCLACGRYN